jgi:DNA-binding transcriptional regulator YdaS (Cro superfamily)
MNMELRINAAAAYVGMSQADVARVVGMSKSNFNQKLKRRSFSEEELADIASAIGAKYEARFEFPDGTRI